MKKKNLSLPTPVIAILGHVDHGKTSLLDAIRKTSLAEKEHGGITQHISAYQIEYQGNKITFIDTPGHEAFAKMRSRGAMAADIAVLVIAANDGIKPQTLESLSHIKSAKIPFLIALNKIDLAEANPDKVKKSLQKENVLIEEYSGDIPLVPVSAKNSQGINKILETIILLRDLFMEEQKNNQAKKLKAVVIESKIQSGKGVSAAVIIREGILSKSDTILCENQEFKIRAISDWQGKQVSIAHAGDPVEIIGWKTPPMVGSLIINKKDALLDKSQKTSIQSAPKHEITIMPQINIEEKKINIIIKADTLGSLEAIKNAVPNDFLIIHSQVGEVNESDILLAKTTNSFVIGFNLKISKNISQLADNEKVILKSYNIIYELIDELKDVVEAVNESKNIIIKGEARIAALFPFDKETVLGVKITSGTMSLGDKIIIKRGKEEIGKSKIKSLKQRKINVTKASEGQEAGILLSSPIKILTGDSIISIG